MSYQENMLVKKHLEMGYDVRVVSFCDDMVNGKKVFREPGEYLGQFGEIIYRLKTKQNNSFEKINIFKRFANYHIGLVSILESFKPNIIFVHGPQTKNVYEIINYKKQHPNVEIYADNHADKINSKRSCSLLGYPLKNIVYGKYARDLSRVIKKFWGTTPARCDFLRKIYRVKKEIIGFLPTGVDEIKITEANKVKGQELLKKHGVDLNKFIIVTGGKFDSHKNIIPLIDSYEELLQKNKNIILVVFGTLDKEYEKYIKNKDIIFLGWLDGSTIINILMNSDLSIFVGGHSTIWEESIAIGLPGVFMKYSGFEHINFNNNVVFIEKNDKNSITYALDYILHDENAYKVLKANAMDEKRKMFYYSEIAKNSIS